MAICKVVKQTGGWNKGDMIEATGDRLRELVVDGVVEVVIPDVIEQPVEIVKDEEKIIESPVVEKTKLGRKKGVK